MVATSSAATLRASSSALLLSAPVLAAAAAVDEDLAKGATVDEELAKIGGRSEGRNGEAVDLLDELVTQERFEEFLTIPAYARLA